MLGNVKDVQKYDIKQKVSGEVVFNMWGRVLEMQHVTGLRPDYVIPIAKLADGIELFLDGSKNTNTCSSTCCVAWSVPVFKEPKEVEDDGGDKKRRKLPPAANAATPKPKTPTHVIKFTEHKHTFRSEPEFIVNVPKLSPISSVEVDSQPKYLFRLPYKFTASEEEALSKKKPGAFGTVSLRFETFVQMFTP